MARATTAEDVRPATASDIARLAELADAALAELSDKRGGDIFAVREAPSRPAAEVLAETLALDSRLVLVARLDGYVAAFGSVRGERLHDGRLLAVVDAIYTEAPFRGVGLGEAVMDGLIDWARQHGCCGVDSIALPGDRETKNFFERFGMKARALLVNLSFSDDVAAPPESAP